ncbi:MAG TPA: hypothetical protein VN181_04330 [Thermoanaerobaculia bacterium]|nr:hypothetical protein [Thermoanaerobaculia bacterium]
MLFQILQLIGAVLILGAFAAQQSKRLEAETVVYQLLNCLGGFCLCAAAIATMQYGFILLEGAWTVLSAAGLVRVIKS